MTSKMTSTVLAATAVLAATLGATGAQAAQTSVTAQARVLRALTLTKNTDLNFGAVVASAAAGNLAIDKSGARTCDTTISCSGTVSAATFTVQGTASEVVSLSVPATVTLDNGTNSMIATLQLSSTSVTIGGGNSANFSVGGTLPVGANQPEGVYDANFTVTANYQ